ncbi:MULTISPECIES: hypothetical protein, partial [unclassified Micromonospora]|uniref:hypothetical protein n=1 Tax=unclassified Micromonospora TaxID=2617518 RepID=UPI003A85507D
MALRDQPPTEWSAASGPNGGQLSAADGPSAGRLPDQPISLAYAGLMTSSMTASRSSNGMNA